MSLDEMLLDVWRDWFEFVGDPWVIDDYGAVYCYFCKCGSPKHADDCAFETARKLIEQNERR